jgi:hypothetical protein
MVQGYPNTMAQNLKTRMSFTDFVPSLSSLASGSLQGVTDWAKSIQSFLSADKSDNSFTQMVDIFESADFVLTMLKNPIISLFVNPQSITVNKNVLLNKQVTEGGFVVQFWGHDLETIAVKAETGYFGLSKVPLNAFNLFKDYCYQGRYNERKPFKAIPILTMLYESQALRGYFNNLTYTVVQQRPYILTFDFTFTVVERVSIPIVSSISKMYNKFAEQKYETGQDIRDQLNFGKGWGVKLY